MKGLAESLPFNLLTNPLVINWFIFGHGVVIDYIPHFYRGKLGCTGVYTFEPQREKTGFRGFRPGPTQADLYSHRSRLEA